MSIIKIMIAFAILTGVAGAVQLPLNTVKVDIGDLQVTSIAPMGVGFELADGSSYISASTSTIFQLTSGISFSQVGVYKTFSVSKVAGSTNMVGFTTSGTAAVLVVAPSDKIYSAIDRVILA